MINIEKTYFDDINKEKNVRTYGDKVYTNFCGVNVPEESAEC